MWLYERCRKEWTDAPKSHAELQAEAIKQPAFQSIINPDDEMFANPVSMVKAIQSYCEQTGQHVPQGYAEICRCIFDSLALRYRQVFSYLVEMASFPLNVLHIIGGGSLNNYLNQFTANSCGVEVLAGPQEGTALGNIMVQAKASGDVKDLWDMRRVIANSLELKRFMPADKMEWDAAYKKFEEIVAKKG
jgi:rhamnulokinase